MTAAQRAVAAALLFLAAGVLAGIAPVEGGVEFQQPPKQESWGTSAVFRDADGNQFVLSSES